MRFIAAISKFKHFIFAVVLALDTSNSSAQTPAQYDKERQRMVDEEIRGAGITDARVLKAMLATPRHEFVMAQYRKQAYFDMALPIGDLQTISGPFVVAYMTQSLDPQPTDKVLEIGTGSGYQAAVLSPLVKDVYSIEIVEPLGKRAENTLKRLKYANIHLKIGDGYEGWPDEAPFDKIIVTCSPEKVPKPLEEQLKEGGLMVIPVGERYQQTLYSYRKKDGKLEAQALRPTLFVPMTGKAEDGREVKPDPTNPQIVNGSFEVPSPGEKGKVQGWYYERRMSWETATDAPEGEHYVTFANTVAGQSSHLLQGFPIDGRKVTELEISVRVRTKNVAQGADASELPYASVSLFDDTRKESAQIFLGPWKGTSAWRTETKTFRVSPKVREAIFRVGLFGGTGEVSFDDIRIRANPK